MNFIRRYKAIIAYVFLVAAIAFSIQQSSAHSEQSRKDLAIQTRAVLLAACERNNELRKTLQEIIAQGAAQIEQYVKDGTLTQEQADRAIAQQRDAYNKVAPIDCKKLYSQSKGKPRSS